MVLYVFWSLIPLEARANDYMPAVLPPLSPSFFRTLGFFASIGGCTLLLSLLSDIISFFLSAHLRIGYELTRLVYWAAGVKLGGGLLWGLFRGKNTPTLSDDAFVERLVHFLTRKEAKCLAQSHGYMGL